MQAVTFEFLCPIGVSAARQIVYAASMIVSKASAKSQVGIN